MRHLNNKLDSVLCESNAKDDLVASHAKMAQEAVAGDFLLLFVFRPIFDFPVIFNN